MSNKETTYGSYTLHEQCKDDGHSFVTKDNVVLYAAELFDEIVFLLKENERLNKELNEQSLDTSEFLKRISNRLDNLIDKFE